MGAQPGFDDQNLVVKCGFSFKTPWLRLNNLRKLLNTAHRFVNVLRRRNQ